MAMPMMGGQSHAEPVPTEATLARHEGRDYEAARLLGRSG